MTSRRVAPVRTLRLTPWLVRAPQCCATPDSPTRQSRTGPSQVELR